MTSLSQVGVKNDGIVVYDERASEFRAPLCHETNKKSLPVRSFRQGHGPDTMSTCRQLLGFKLQLLDCLVELLFCHQMVWVLRTQSHLLDDIERFLCQPLTN